jgi:hypothetical protein
MRRHTKSLISTLVTIAVLGASTAVAGPINETWLGNAIEGYDTVAYHTEGRPVEGSDAFEFEWTDLTWRFASDENRQLFAAEPEKYAPAYGGFCAYGVSLGAKPSIDPEAWRIVDGTLYLNLSKDIQGRWGQDIPGYIAKADEFWPTIIDD